MEIDFHRTHPRLLLTALIILTIGFSLAVRFVHLGMDFEKQRDLYFYDHGVPLMTTLDAYFYLDIARKCLPGGSYASTSPRSLPLLPVMTAALQKATGVMLENIAFYLPPLLALLMIAVYFCWGRELGGTTIFALSALIGTGSYYWYMRTCLGRFDTDSLIPFFAYAISYAAYLFSVRTGWVRRGLALAAALALIYLFQWWWPPGRLLGLPLLLAPYGLSVFFHRGNKPERYLKICVLLSGILFAVSVLFNLYRHLPAGLSWMFKGLAPLINLVVKGPGQQLSEVGSSISELEPATWEILSGGMAGNAILLGLSVIGFLFLIKDKYKAIALMAMPVLLGFGSFFAGRLLIFLVPIYALSLSYLLVRLFEGKISGRLSPSIRQWVFLAACVLVVGVNSARSFTRTVAPKLTSYQVALATAVRDDSDRGATIWNWWDDGYFLNYYAQRRTIMDGGNQTPDRMFVTAFPLTADDPTLAANWMRFFAARGMAALKTVNRHFKDMPESILFLKRALAQKEPLRNLLIEFGLEDERYWQNYLFPKTHVYLYLNHDLFQKAHWWYYFGTANASSGAGMRPKTLFLSAGQFSIDSKKGVLAFEDRLLNFSHLYLCKFLPVPRVVASRRYEGRTGPTVVWVKGFDLVYVFDTVMDDCLFLKLLLFNPYSPPKAFKMVKFFPLKGGVWKIEP